MCILTLPAVQQQYQAPESLDIAITLLLVLSGLLIITAMRRLADRLDAVSRLVQSAATAGIGLVLTLGAVIVTAMAVFMLRTG